MEKIIEKKSSKYGNFIINPELNKYNKMPIYSKKLVSAIEMIERYGLHESDEHLDIITLTGFLKYANAENNTFTIAREVDWKTEIIDYKVTALPQTLTDLVKKYWGEKITISVKPIRSNGEILEYKLIELM
jgi:tellurite resistance-related uncharacterized protein